MLEMVTGSPPSMKEFLKRDSDHLGAAAAFP